MNFFALDFSLRFAILQGAEIRFFPFLIRFHVNSILVGGKSPRLQILNCHKVLSNYPTHVKKKPTKSSISHPKVNVFLIGSAYPNFNTGVGIPVFFVDKA